MKSLKEIKKELKEEFMKRSWQTEQYATVYDVMLKFIEEKFYGEENKDVVIFYKICPDCNKKKGIWRFKYKNYRCRKCKLIFD